MSKWSCKKNNNSSRAHDGRMGSFRPAVLASVIASIFAAQFATQVSAQENTAASAKTSKSDEEVVVFGTRSTIRSSIESKRIADTVTEVLSSDDIGEIPALSIGEALETLTSAASHREQGGATEISIRGMGPYLGSTVMNGREATNGSGDRSVNFSQFPSELFSKIAIHKTQSASLIEGGVSGQISLDTLRPIDYGKRRFQGEIKGNYNPDNNDIDDSKRDIGSRITASFIDQFDVGDSGVFGFSLGVQSNRATNPEQEYRTSSTYRDCRNDRNFGDGDVGVYATGNCDSGDGDLRTEIDPDTGLSQDDDNTPVIFVPSSRTFRQNITDDERDSLFFAAQWQPNDKLDFNFDVQVSDRTFTEERNDLVFSEQRRVNPEGLVATTSGAVLEFNNSGRVETHSQYQERIEEYRGGGLSFDLQATDNLSFSFDASYSNTKRLENIIQTRLQSEPRDIFGEDTPAGTDRPATSYILPGSRNDGGSEVALVTLTNFDVNNHNLFADSARTRVDLNQDREHTVSALRADFDLQTDWSMISSLEGGLRFSSMEFTSFPRVRDELTYDDAAIETASLACRNESFPESGFLSERTNGQNIITNVDDEGRVIGAGTGNTFATFNARCLAQELVSADNALRLAADPNAETRSIDGFPSREQTVNNVDVEEDTVAAYIQANYETTIASKPVRGNFGVRVVHSDVTSTGLRTTFTSSTDPGTGVVSIEEDDEAFVTVEGGGSYTEVLPSASIVVNLDEDLLLRGGIFRGLSRPDPADLGFGRSFDAVSEDDSPTSITDFTGAATAPGNPDLEPLLSWNYDLAVEWYPNDDTIIALGGYYKQFQGGFENVRRVEQFEVDGQVLNANVVTTRTDSNTSTLKGYEVSLAHSFSYLPGALSGLGAKFSYNHAVSDFEFEHSNFGASEVEDENGNVISQRIGIVPPANLFGFSEDVASSQLYYQIGDLDLQFIYKYRSEYFQQFISSPGQLRYVGDTEVFEARVTYKVTDNITVRLEGINLFDEPKTQYNPIDDNVAEVNSYGPRYFLSVKAKF